MQEKQIFKPFEQFEEGEFDKMFGFSAKGFDFGVYTFLPEVAPEGTVAYHIVAMRQNGTAYYKILERKFHESGLSTNNLSAPSFTIRATKSTEHFYPLGAAYEALRAHLIICLKVHNRKIRDAQNLIEMPFEEYLQLPKNQELLKIRFRSVTDPKMSFEAFANLPQELERLRTEQKQLIWILKQLSEPIAAAAEQFPNA